MSDLAQLQTEGRNADTVNIDLASSLELCQTINKQDQAVALAVEKVVPNVAKAVDLVVSHLARGGRVVYTGAGTSGRLGILDASEMMYSPPTFSANPDQFIGLIAGGEPAIRSAIEGAEDSEAKGAEALQKLSPPFSDKDVVIGIASSGRTPYVLGSLKYARSVGGSTIGVACVQPSAMSGMCDVLIECVTGPEVVTGSTRLKAGTATKMILNMISTGSQIRLGKTFGNLMVDLSIRNIKLADRARRVIRAVVPPPSLEALQDDDEVDKLIKNCGGSVKLAILSAMLQCDAATAKKKLEENQGVLRKVLQAEGKL